MRTLKQVCDYKVNQRLGPVLKNHLGTVAMDRNVENYDANRKTSDNGIKSNKCYQCDYAFSQAGNLRKHLKTHTGEKSNKCNQCNYACVQASNLRAHLKTHRPFEATFENAQWRKVKQMQPM